jgi:hypothetical protein
LNVDVLIRFGAVLSSAWSGKVASIPTLSAARIRDAEASASQGLGCGCVSPRASYPRPREANSIHESIGFSTPIGFNTGSAVAEFRPFNGNATCEEACDAGL